MSNRSLDRLLRGGGLTEFHVVAAGRRSRDSGPPVFNGERFEFSASAKSEYKKEYKKEHEFAKKENREEGGEKRKKGGDDSSDHSDSDDDGPHFKGKGDTSGKNGFPGKGKDGDGDGEKGEKRKAGKKGKGPWQDEDGDGKPNKVDKK